MTTARPRRARVRIESGATGTPLMRLLEAERVVDLEAAADFRQLLLSDSSSDCDTACRWALSRRAVIVFRTPPRLE
jgi:hypothetical protein